MSRELIKKSENKIPSTNPLEITKIDLQISFLQIFSSSKNQIKISKKNREK